MKKARIIGTGSATGSELLTNLELIKRLNEIDYEKIGAALLKRGIEKSHLTDPQTFDLFVKQITGVTQRYFCTEQESVETMAVKAARKALSRAEINYEKVGEVILSTFTSNHDIPTPASVVEGKLREEEDIKPRAVTTINSACCGFIDGLIIACERIESERYETALVIASEQMSKRLNFTDKEEVLRTVLFGDAASAAVVQVSDSGGIIGYSRGQIPSKNITLQRTKPLDMQSSPEILRNASRYMSDELRKALEDSGKQLEDLAAICPHPANISIIELAAKTGGWPREKVVNVINKVANPSGAGVGIAYDRLSRDEAKNLDGKPIKIQKGNLVGICAVAGGYLFNAGVVEY